ncbi:hypothetical protein NY62_07565 [Salmonella enterica subsp. enterica serovar Newport]|nr:hypothetical protein [Salmonella enterica subsp. enterica serovar Newport]
MNSKFIRDFYNIKDIPALFENKITVDDVLYFAAQDEIELCKFIKIECDIFCSNLTTKLKDWIEDPGYDSAHLKLGNSEIQKSLKAFRLNICGNEYKKSIEGLYLNIGSHVKFPVIAGDIWSLHAYDIGRLIKYDSDSNGFTIPASLLKPSDYDENLQDSLGGTWILQDDSNISINRNNLIITKKQINKLNSLINNSTEPAINKKVERHASGREIILAAVVTELFRVWKANDNSSEDKASANKLAKLINDNGVWYGLGEPDDDLTESIRKVILDAIRKPEERQSIGKYYRQVKHKKGK